MHILSALFIEAIDLRQVAGPATHIDLTGIHFSAPAPTPVPTTIQPHLVVIVHCPPDHRGEAALEVVYAAPGSDDPIARNVSPLQVEPGKFNYRLVRAELELEEYGAIEARCRIDQGAITVVPFTLLPPVAATSAAPPAAPTGDGHLG